MKHDHFIVVIALIFIFGCSSPEDYTIRKVQLAGLPAQVDLVEVGDLISSRKLELVCARDSILCVYGVTNYQAKLIFTDTLSDQIMKLGVGELGGYDGLQLVVTTGRARYQETDVRVFVYNLQDQNRKELVFSRFSIRPQVTTLQIADRDGDGNNEILLSYFESKYFVDYVAIEKVQDEWQSTLIEKRRMAMSRYVGRLPGYDLPQTVVGRVYGDEIGMTGDAYLLGETPVMIPAKIGVKTVRIADANSDGQTDIILGDGWHQDYGKIARGRLAWVQFKNDSISYELIEDVKNQYEISQIEVGDINGDKVNEVIARGNQFTRLYQKQSDGWKVYRDSLLPAKQFTLGDLVGDSRPELIFSGDSICIFQFHMIPFVTELDREISTKKVYPVSLVGKPAPELSVVKWYNANFPGLYNSRNKVVLLDFWATWCKPCIKTFPELARWQSKYSEQGLQIVGLTKVDQRQDQKTIERFVTEQEFPYPIGLSDETLNKLAYGVGGIPHLVLIDRKGIVRYFKVGSGQPEQTEKMIQNLINE